MKHPDSGEAARPEKVSLVPLLITFFSTFLGMAALEIANEKVLPGLSVWGSHLLTIAAGVIVATVAAGLIQGWRRRSVAKLTEEIRQRELVESALGESEEKSRGFFEGARDGFLVANEQGVVTKWNQSYEELTGLGASDIEGQHLWSVPIGLDLSEADPGKTSEKLKSSWLEFQRTGNAPWTESSQRLIIRQPNGPDRAIERVVFPIRTSKGLALGVIVRGVEAGQ